MSKKDFIILLSLIGIFLNSCISIKPVLNPDLKMPPAAFSTSIDSLNSSNIKWRDYFSDPILVHYIDTALKNNLDLKMSLQNIEMARANIRYANGLLRPNFFTNASASLYKYGNYTSTYAGNSSTDITPGRKVPAILPDYTFGMQASWELDISGKLHQMKNSAVARYLSSVEGQNWVQTNLIAELAKAYYELLALQNDADIINETIGLQQNAYELIQIQKDAGRTNELAVKQAESQLLNSKELLFENQQEIAVAESNFNQLLGRFPETVQLNKSSLNNAIPVKISSGIPSDLLRNRPDIRQAEAELLATKADVKAAKANFYPSFNISSGLGFDAFNLKYLIQTPGSMALNLLGNLTAPVINRRAIESQYMNANANQLAAFYNYQKSILNGFVEVHNELSTIQKLEQALSLKTAEVNAQSQSVQISSELFKTGRATYLEVILAQQNALQAKLALNELKKRQLLATINIYKALGGGWK